MKQQLLKRKRVRQLTVVVGQHSDILVEIQMQSRLPTLIRFKMHLLPDFL